MLPTNSLLLRVAAALVALSSIDCGGDPSDDRTTGGPFTGIGTSSQPRGNNPMTGTDSGGATAVPDGARLDTATVERPPDASTLDAPRANDAGPAGTVGDARVDVILTKAEACQMCEATMCRKLCIPPVDWYGLCFEDNTAAVAGRKMGTPKKELCQAVLACLRKTKCADPDNVLDGTKCYCGDVDDLDCAGGAAA